MMNHPPHHFQAGSGVGGAADAMANLSVSGGGGGGSSGGGGLREVVDKKMTTAKGTPFLYTGPVNEEGKAHGKGTAKSQGDGAGHVYEGDWVDDKKHGKGTYTWANGEVDVKQYNMDKAIGEGARWSSDRRTAWRLKDGNKGGKISLAEAVQIARRLGLPVPP